MIILDKCERCSERVDGDLYHMTPAEYVIFIFNGVTSAAAAIGRRKATISKWQNPKIRSRGAHGLIPVSVQRRVLEIAKEKGLDLNAEDLIFGRKVRVKFE